MSSKETVKADLDPVPVERFWGYVNKENKSGCWEWVGGSNVRRYGMFRGGLGRSKNGGRKMIRSHRFAYELLVGPIPAGLHLDHKCRNTICVNPDHLEPVTNAVNLQRQGLSKNNTSGVRGVSWYPRNNKWRIQVKQLIDGKQKHHFGGYYTDDQFALACEKVIAMRLEIFGPDDEREARIEVDQALASPATRRR